MPGKKTETQGYRAEPPAEELLRAYQERAPFERFVAEVMGYGPFDYTVVLDEVTQDGWRVIDLEVTPLGAEPYLSTIFLCPAVAGRFMPKLDFPF